MSKYKKTVAAAVSETRSKFALAEALATEIPPQQGRRNDLSGGAKVSGHLADARQAIIDAGGEPRAVATLDGYRLTALWTSGGTARSFAWVAGYSFTAHNEARKAGIPFDEFAAEPRTTDRIRRDAGKAGTDGPPARVVETWTPQERDEAVRELVSNPETRQSVRKALDDHYEQTPKPIETPAGTNGEPLELLTRFRRVHKDVDRIIELVLQGQAVVSDAERAALIEEARWLRAASEHIETGLDAGSLEKSLRQFQEEYL